MVGKQISIAPERIVEGKQLYELTGTPVSDIAALMGVSRRTLERRLHQWGWVPRRAPRTETDRALVAAPPAPVAASASADPASAITPGEAAAMRSANAVRIQQLVANSLNAVDRVLAKVGPVDEGGAERSARTLAAVTRALQEMAAMTQPDDEAPPDAVDDEDAIPRDIDEIREALARRIHALIDAESGANSADRGESAAGAEPAGG